MLQITVTVETADVATYGVGGLLRAERGPTWVEFTTVPLVAGDTVIRDNGGTDASTYRTRYSTAVPTVAGDYSAYSEVVPASPVTGGLLTVADFRELVTTSIVDHALQGLLNAAELAITKRYGVVGLSTDIRAGGGGLIQLSRRAASINSVTEQWFPDASDSADLAQDTRASAFWLEGTALAVNDYTLDQSGLWLQRRGDGDNPASTWGQAVKVNYLSFDDTAERRRVQLKLVQLDIATQPGLAAQTIGPWMEQYSGSSVWNYEAEREAILASMGPGWGFA